MSALIGALNCKALDLKVKSLNKLNKNLGRKNNNLREELQLKTSSLSEANRRIEEFKKYNAYLKTISKNCLLCQCCKNVFTIDEMNSTGKLTDKYIKELNAKCESLKKV